MLMKNETVKSVCDLCARGCGVLIEIENGTPIKVSGDPDCPVNKGTLCIKGYASVVHHRY